MIVIGTSHERLNKYAPAASSNEGRQTEIPVSVGTYFRFQAAVTLAWWHDPSMT